MSVGHVLVYADGTVGLRDFEREMSVFRQPRLMSLTVSAVHEPSVLPVLYDEYWQRGRMFDGRPILCDPGHSVKQAAMTILVSKHDDEIEHAEAHLKREIEAFLRREYSVVIPLDRWSGEVPYHEEDLESRRLVCLGVKALVAVPA